MGSLCKPKIDCVKNSNISPFAKSEIVSALIDQIFKNMFRNIVIVEESAVILTNAHLLNL